MNKKYLKENNLYEAHKQFMRLCEVTSLQMPLEEDDDEQMDDQMMGGNEQQDMNGQNGGEMPQDNQMMGNEQNGGDMMGNGMEDQMPDDQGMDNQDMNDPMMGGDMMGDGMEDPMMDMEDEEVIDVDQLTDAQEKMNDKVNLVGRNLEDFDSKINALMQSLSKMENMINANNDEIVKFKQEFEKRNPTQTEKLNLRSLDSYPFNVNPKDYWAEKGIDPNSNYSAIANNSLPTTQEYEITNNDVDNFDNKFIEDSFEITDDLEQDLKKIFGL